MTTLKISTEGNDRTEGNACTGVGVICDVALQAFLGSHGLRLPSFPITITPPPPSHQSNLERCDKIKTKI